MTYGWVRWRKQIIASLHSNGFGRFAVRTWVEWQWGDLSFGHYSFKGDSLFEILEIYGEVNLWVVNVKL